MPGIASRYAIVLFLAAMILGTSAAAAAPFRFEDYPALDDMRIYIEKNFPLGADRDALRRAFVEEGKGVLKEHPSMKGVEKYMYDINLCDMYIFRWNISADFSEGGKLEQAYVNGRFVYMKGREPRTLEAFYASSRGKSKLMDVPRKMAPKARRPIRYTVYDLDGNFTTSGDQLVDGPGPQRAEPPSTSILAEYQAVEPWRSIFEPDAANTPARFSPCKGMPVRNQQLEQLLGKDIEQMRKDVEKLRTPEPKP